MPPKNRIADFEQEICAILAQLCHHIHPAIIERIQSVNERSVEYFADLFAGQIETSHYLYRNSACVFPGVRRYEGRKAEYKKLSYNAAYRAIIDDIAPRHLWCFLVNGKPYSGGKDGNWKKTGLSTFELAHVFAHKTGETEFERQFFRETDVDLSPYGDFSCACNVVLLPKGTVRPTDNSPAIKAAFYRRYLCLYGEGPLNGRRKFNHSMVPEWYGDLHWNEPYLPSDWETKVDRLLEYRRNQIARVLAQNR